jgi:hypothetical protein
LIDRLVADLHELIIGEIDLKTVGDLLGAPPLHPPVIPTMGLVAALPRWAWRTDGAAIWSSNVSRDPILHVRS